MPGYKICALAIMALVVLTAAMWGVMALQWYAQSGTMGSPAGFWPAPPASQSDLLDPPSENRDPAATASAAVVGDVTSLMSWSMIVNMLIFVGLGLFLRWDLRRRS